MKCKCISNIEKAQLESIHRPTGKAVIWFEFTEDSVGNFYNFKTGKDVGPKTKSTVRYKIEGHKKVYNSFMSHNFCPFCGKKC